jgi:hypothetical protein
MDHVAIPALGVGLSWTVIWASTPFELKTRVEALSKQQVKADIRAAWLGEMYHRTEKLPPLGGELDRIDGKAPQDEILEGEMAVNFAKAMTLAQGGEVRV